MTLPIDSLFSMKETPAEWPVFAGDSATFRTAVPSDVAGTVPTLVVGNVEWVVGLSLLLFAILAVIVYHGRDYIASKLKDFFSSERQFNGVNAPQPVGEVRNTFLLLSVTAVSLAFIWLDNVAMLPDVRHRHIPLPLLLCAIYAACMAIFYFKALLYRMVNGVFFSREQGEQWMSAYFLLTSLLAFAVFPISQVEIFVPRYSQKVAFCLLFLLIIYEILLFFKCYANFKTKKYGYLLIFLYFCSVELVPLLICWHFLQLNHIVG